MTKKEIFKKFASNDLHFCHCCYKTCDRVIIMSKSWDFHYKHGFASLCEDCFLKGEEHEK